MTEGRSKSRLMTCRRRCRRRGNLGSVTTQNPEELTFGSGEALPGKRSAKTKEANENSSEESATIREDRPSPETRDRPIPREAAVAVGMAVYRDLCCGRGVIRHNQVVHPPKIKQRKTVETCCPQRMLYRAGSQTQMARPVPRVDQRQSQMSASPQTALPTRQDIPALGFSRPLIHTKTRIWPRLTHTQQWILTETISLPRATQGWTCSRLLQFHMAAPLQQESIRLTGPQASLAPRKRSGEDE